MNQINFKHEKKKLSLLDNEETLILLTSQSVYNMYLCLFIHYTALHTHAQHTLKHSDLLTLTYTHILTMFSSKCKLVCQRKGCRVS